MNEHKIITEIMQRHGATCTPEEFHSAVNVVFHEFESEEYDTLHQDMWQSLPAQVGLLVGDAMRHGGLPETLDVLDIGCGTGLATDCLMKTPLGARVRSIDLLDTSKSMLGRAMKRSVSWGVPATPHEGLLDSLPDGKRYGLIITSSVLHHVPDLDDFLRTVRRLQQPGGVFIHLQDPNGDHLKDPELARRMASTADHRPEWLQRLTPSRVLGRIRRQLTGQQGQDYISKAIRELVNRGVVKTPLSVIEVFSVTDIHVHDDEGISIRELAKYLPDYTMVGQRSYGFFGKLASVLPSHLRAEEERLIAANDPTGFHVGAAWVLPAAR